VPREPASSQVQQPNQRQLLELLSLQPSSLRDACALVSLHGRTFERIVPLLQPGARILALSWDGTTPARLAGFLAERGMGKGKYGFHFALPAAARDGHEHWVVPVVVDTPSRMITGPDIGEPYIIHSTESDMKETHKGEEPATPKPAPAATPASR